MHANGCSFPSLFSVQFWWPVVHDAARFPYFVIDGSSGIPASTFLNSWMVIPSEFAIAAILVAGTLMTVFVYLLYSLFLKAFGAKL
jgi:hypothetical protein